MPKHQIITDVSPEIMREFALDMTEEDKRSVNDVTAVSPSEALVASMEASEEYAVWVCDGKPMAIFGIAKPRSVTSDFHYAWMYNTKAASKHKKLFYWGSVVWIKAAKAKYGELRAHCDSRNPTSLKWLQKLGFKSIGTTRMGESNVMFYRLRNV